MLESTIDDRETVQPMNTPSHLIMTAALRKRAGGLPIPTLPVLLGSVAPDLALTLLSVGGMVYYRSVVGLSRATAFRHMYDTMYFQDPVWIAAHNLLHAPILLVLALALLWPYRWQADGWRRFCFWFLVACLLHSAVDLLTHVDDGPLLFFPFNWTVRFVSPVSYWDRRYYGAQFAVFELVFDLGLLAYLWTAPIVRWLRRSRPPV